MSLFHFKSILALIFLVTGVIAVICMLTLMGRSERKISAVFLRRLHKVAGFIFAILFLVISYFCIKYVAMIGDKLSLRAVLHGVLALGLFIILALKLSIVQFYKQFLRYVPGLGMTVFALAFVVFSTSAGFFFLSTSEHIVAEKPPSEVMTEGDAQLGQTLFEKNCSFCHYADKFDSKLGPGLQEILKKDKLPVSRKAATPESVKDQLVSPYKNMPSFESSLTEQDIENLVAYLRTL